MQRSGRVRRVFVAASAAAVVSAVCAASAPAASDVILSTALDTYSANTYNADGGSLVQFQWNGGGSHDVTARANGPDNNLLFRSATISSGTAPVNGTQYLTQGPYDFFCTVHPFSMQAKLVITGAGTPVARPDIEVKIGKATLDKVASKGKLPVTVQALTKSDDAEVTLKLGATTLASKENLDLAAGTTRKLTLKLTKTGKNKLDDRNSAKLKLTGEVPFGSPDTAKKTLK